MTIKHVTDNNQNKQKPCPSNWINNPLDDVCLSIRNIVLIFNTSHKLSSTTLYVKLLHL